MKTKILGLSIVSVLAVVACKSRKFQSDGGGDSGALALKVTNAGVCDVETDTSVEGLFAAAQDPFKTQVMKTAGCKDKMKNKDPYVIDTFMKNAGCTIGKRFIVSERGQLTVSTETPTDPRTVDEWICGKPTGDPDENPNIAGRVWISGPGSAMHIIAWDGVNKTFQFYSADHVSSTPKGITQIFYHGTSHNQAVASTVTARHPCTTCHVGGGLLMKELRFPWVFWHTPVSPLPGVRDKVWTRATDSAHPVAIAEHFEIQTMQTLSMANQTYVRNLGDGKNSGSPLPQNASAPISYKNLLYPLFCDRGVSIATSSTTYASGKVSVPPDLMLNRLLVPKGGKVTLTAGIDVNRKGQTSRLDTTGFDDTTDYEGLFESNGTANRIATFGAAEWAAKATLFFEPLAGANKPDGQVFPLISPVRHFADDDLVSRLVVEGIIPEDFAINVLLTDIQNPVFSLTRCTLLDNIPSSLIVPARGEFKAKGAAMVAQFEAAVNASPDKGKPGSGPAKYLAMKALGDKAAFVVGFANSCKANFAIPAKAAKAMAFRWKNFEDVPRGIGSSFKGPDFNRAVEDFVQKEGIPRLKSVKNDGITQGCDVP